MRMSQQTYSKGVSPMGKDIETTTKVTYNKNKKQRPALTPENREQQLVALAVDLAEEQIRAGTASSQIIYHFLKAGSPKEKLEREILEAKKKLIEEQTKGISDGESAKVRYEEALTAFRTYQGLEDV